MNDERIEQLLRKAPRSPAPAGLLETLRRDITLPRRMEVRPMNPTGATPFIWRWFPTVSFAAIFLACIAAIAVQTNQITGLKQENATLQTSAHSLEQLRRDNTEYQRLKAAHEELERLRRDSAELQQLRSEVMQLRAQTQEIDKLRAENHGAQDDGVHEVARERCGSPRPGEVLERDRRGQHEARGKFAGMKRGPERVGERQDPQYAEEPRPNCLEREPRAAKLVGRRGHW